MQRVIGSGKLGCSTTRRGAVDHDHAAMPSRGPMTARARAVAALSSALLLVAACSSGGGSSPEVVVQDDPTTSVAPVEDVRRVAADAPGDWTVFVYMAADNDLEAAAVDDMAQMADATGTEFVVLLDRHPGYSDDPIGELGNFTETVMLHVVDGRADIVSRPGELNMGDPATLGAFLSEGLTEFGNDHNALVIWDHGGSWRGAAWDETDGDDNLDIDEIAEGIEEGLADADVEFLDLIGFDACLMATYEVVAPLAPYATYLIASEELEPGHGWDWGAIDTPAGGSSTQDFAQGIIDGFMAEAEAAGETATTLSVLDLTRMHVLDDAATELARVMNDEGRSIVGRVSQSRKASLSFGRNPNPKGDYFLVDLGTLAAELRTVPGMEDAARQLEDAIGEVVVRYENGPVLADATGLAAHFPPWEDLLDPRYMAADFAPRWTEVVDAYFSTVAKVDDDELPVFTDPDLYLDEDQVPSDADGLSFTAEVTRGTGGNVAHSTFHWGEVSMEDTDQVVWFGQSNARVEGDDVKAEYDWRYLQISDGTTVTTAYADLNYGPDGDLNRIVVPITYMRGSSSAEGTLQLLLDDGTITSEAFFLRTGGVVAPFKPRTGDTFVPMLKHQNLIDFVVEWLPATTTPLAAPTAGLQYRYGTLPGAVPIMVGVEMADIGGTYHYAFHGTATPAELG